MLYVRACVQWWRLTRGGQGGEEVGSIISVVAALTAIVVVVIVSVQVVVKLVVMVLTSHECCGGMITVTAVLTCAWRQLISRCEQ